MSSRRRSTSRAPAGVARCWLTYPETFRRRRSTSSTPTRSTFPGWKPPRRGHPRQIKAAARRLAEAERPVLYVGGGTINAEACNELKELAEFGRLPVITTLMGKSAFPEQHELFCGWPGMHGPKWSNWAMNKADLLVACGARFDDRVTGKLTAFAPGASVIHLDIDAAEIGKLRNGPISRSSDPSNRCCATSASELRRLSESGCRASLR